MFVIQVFLLIIILGLVKGEPLKCEKSGSSRTPVSKIMEKILCNYDKDYRPVKDQKRKLNVTIRLGVKSIDVTDDTDECDMHNFLTLMWKDEFLVWNPDEFNSVKQIHIPSSKIWIPDMNIIKSNDKAESALSEPADCIVRNTGYISCLSDNMHEVMCTSNMDKWPYDTRVCSIRYSTGIHNSSEVYSYYPPDSVHLTRKLVLFENFENPAWKLLNGSSTVYLAKNTIDNGTSEYVKFNLALERQSSRTFAIIYVPVFSLITMTLLPLCMKPGNVERFCLVASNILNHFLFIQHLEYIIPMSGNKLPRIVSFFRDSLGISVAVLIELTLIKSLVANRRAAAPKWLLTPCKFLSTGLFGRILLINETLERDVNATTTTTQDTTETNIIVQSENNKDANIVKKSQMEKYLIATIIDRFVLALLALVYFILAVCLIPL